MINRPLFIGIDGGGTGCRALLGDASGEILGAGKAGSANIATDPKGALGNIEAAAREALAAAGVAPAAISELDAFLGLAGANVETYTSRVLAGMPFRRAIVEHDALISLEGAVGDGDGCIGILGTGSAFIARRGGVIRTVGGWGFYVSDHGSGAKLGQTLLIESLLSHDGVQAHTDATRAILDQYNQQPGEIMQFARTATPADFGRFAPLVFEFADAGDAIALSIVSSAVVEVERAFDSLLEDRCARLSLCGGLAQCYLPYLSEAYRERVDAPIADAVTGALSLARRHFSEPPVAQQADR